MEDNLCLKKITLAPILLLLLLFLPSFSLAQDIGSTQESSQQVVLSQAQWNNLKRITQERQMILEQLEIKLANLEANSTIQGQDLTELSEQLTKCKNQIVEVQMKLDSAEISLNEANSLIQKNNQLLTTLKEQIDSLKHKATVARRQRDVWAVLSGVLVTYIIHDKVS